MQAEADRAEGEGVPQVASSPYAQVADREHALRLGMWVFLGSESLLFAGLFGLYASYRTTYTASFARAAAHNEEWIGSTNTFVLILSSFFVAWSIHCMRQGRTRACAWSLVVTLLLGGLFLGFKSLEYAHHLSVGIAPGSHYTFAELPEHGARLFFTLYYCLTGLHAIHVLAGMAILTWILLRVVRRKTVPKRHVELELGGLYWHLIDVVWIFLWPILYLIK